MSLILPNSSLALVSRSPKRAAPTSLLTNLVSYWKMDEVSGTRVDSHGTNDLTDNNTVGSAAGIINLAGSYIAANSEFLSRASNVSLQTGNIDYTIACWINYSDVSGVQVIAGKDNSGTANEWLLFTNGTLQMAAYTAGGAQIATGLAPSPLTWYFVVGWHDATAATVNLQINDGAVVSQPMGGVQKAPGAANFQTGARESTLFFKGLIDEVGFWKRILTATERTALYNAGAGLSYPF